MPLRCLDPTTGASIHAFDQSPEAWQALEHRNRCERHLRMPCCSSEVTLRRSRRGTQHFAHKTRGACTTGHETETHLRLKRIVVEVARSCGWHAETEVVGATPSGETWKADILAQRKSHKVAVEIQWSPQKNEETMRRQERYRRSGVRGLWLLRQAGFPVDHDLPAARISESTEHDLLAHVPTASGERRLSMQDFLKAAFEKRLRFGIPLSARAEVSIWAGELFCWSCGAETRIVTRVQIAVGLDEYTFSVPELDAHLDVFQDFCRHIPNELGIGVIKPRFSKTQGRTYLSNGCAHCDRLLGEFHEYEAWPDQRRVCDFTISINEKWRQAMERINGCEPSWGIYSFD